MLHSHGIYVLLTAKNDSTESSQKVAQLHCFGQLHLRLCFYKKHMHHLMIFDPFRGSLKNWSFTQL